MATFGEAFLSGVALASVGFIAKETVSFQITAYKLRKLLATDVADIVDGLRAHRSSLDEIRNHLKEGLASFIWEGQGSGAKPAFLGDVPVYLSVGESSLALNFYNAVGRIDAIRSEFQRCDP